GLVACAPKILCVRTDRLEVLLELNLRLNISRVSLALFLRCLEGAHFFFGGLARLVDCRGYGCGNNVFQVACFNRDGFFFYTHRFFSPFSFWGWFSNAVLSGRRGHRRICEPQMARQSVLFARGCG